MKNLLIHNCIGSHTNCFMSNNLILLNILNLYNRVLNILPSVQPKAEHKRVLSLNPNTEGLRDHSLYHRPNCFGPELERNLVGTVRSLSISLPLSARALIWKEIESLA